MGRTIAGGQVAAETTARRKTRTGLQGMQTRTAWLFLAPSLAVVVFIALFPLAQTFYLSFTNKPFLAGSIPEQFVGWTNYYNLIHDTVFRNTIWFTIKFAIVTVVCEFVLGMIVALVVNTSFKGRGLMRTAMLVPWAIPTVINARIWQWMYDDIYGVFNDILTRLHIISSPIAWTSSSTWGLWSVAAVDIWKTTPFVALLLLAGLQVIPGDIYEAADVDGANKIQQFFRITLPLLVPAIMVTLVFRTLDALRVFDVVYVLLGASRLDTQTMAIYDQTTIVNGQVGYGSAIAVGIFFIIGIFVVAYVTIFKVDAS